MSLPFPPSLLPPEPYIQITNKHVQQEKNGISERNNFKTDYSAKVTTISPDKSRNKQTNNSQMVRLLDNENPENISIGSFSMNGDLGKLKQSGKFLEKLQIFEKVEEVKI